MEVITSQQGKKIVILEGYRYRLDRNNADGTSSWRCIVHTCRGRVKRNEDGDAIKVFERSHALDPARNEAEKVKSKIRHRATDTLDKPRQIMQQCTAGIPLEAVALLPSYRACHRTVERKRKLDEVLVAPNTLAEINIPQNLRSTIRGNIFLLWDSGNDDENRMFIFGTMRNLELLEEYKQWFMDGTFKVAPELFFSGNYFARFD